MFRVDDEVAISKIFTNGLQNLFVSIRQWSGAAGEHGPYSLIEREAEIARCAVKEAVMVYVAGCGLQATIQAAGGCHRVATFVPHRC